MRLINDVLDLAKIEAGRMDLNPEPFLLAEAVGEVCAVARAMAQKKHIALRTQIAPDLDSVTLDQALTGRRSAPAHRGRRAA